jgi:hypothetical protein
MPKRHQTLNDIARAAENRAGYIAEGITLDRMVGLVPATRPPVREPWGNAVYQRSYNMAASRITLDDLDAPLASTATAAELEAFARERMRGLAPSAANIERLIAVTNELKQYRRPVQPRATIAAAIDIFHAAAWAEVLLSATLSPGFVDLHTWDQETVVRVHGALLIRIAGGHLETRR